MNKEPYKGGRRGFIKTALLGGTALAAGSTLINCGSQYNEDDYEAPPKLGVPLYRDPSQEYSPEAVNQFFDSLEPVDNLDENLARFFNAVYRNQLQKEVDPTLTLNITPLYPNLGEYIVEINEIRLVNQLFTIAFYRYLVHETGHYFDYRDGGNQSEFISLLHEDTVPFLSLVELPSREIFELVIGSVGNGMNGMMDKVGTFAQSERPDKYELGTIVSMEYFNACGGDFNEAEKLLNNTPLSYLVEQGHSIHKDNDTIFHTTCRFFENIIQKYLSKVVEGSNETEKVTIHNDVIDTMVENIADTFVPLYRDNIEYLQSLYLDNYDFEKYKIPLGSPLTSSRSSVSPKSFEVSTAETFL